MGLIHNYFSPGLVSDHNQAIRHPNAAMSEEGIRYGNGVLIVAAYRHFPARVIFVGVCDPQNEGLEFDHNQGLDKVSVHGVPHPPTPGLDLQTALPAWMKSIDLVLEGGLSVLTEEHWPLYFVGLLLAALDGKPE